MLSIFFPRNTLSRSQTTAAFIALLVSTFNLVYISLHVSSLWRQPVASSMSAAPRPEPKSFSYRGHDFPEYLPVPDGDLKPVLHTMEESTNYPLLGALADDQWHSLATTSEGYVRLGPEKRIFAVTMFHELHCLRMINLAFSKSKLATVGHLKHCLSYLRQNALCAADLTLEPGDFEERDFEVDKVGAEHICRDWHTVYEVLEDNYVQWIANH